MITWKILLGLLQKMYGIVISQSNTATKHHKTNIQGECARNV